MKIVVERKAWYNFLRRAKKRFPKEYIEFLWGEETVDAFRIVKFQKVPHSATSTSISYDDDLIKEHQIEAKKEGLIFLGSIHTHPHYEDCSASQTDHHGATTSGERLMGILGLTKSKKTEVISSYVQWWIPQPPMNFIMVD